MAGKLPDAERTRVASALDALVMRTIRIEAVRAQMKFDVSHITLSAGEEVEIEFVNADEMPHNLLITAPGAMETVSLAAEAMAKDPSAFAKHFVPESKDVLFSTPLVAPGESVRLRFTAPTLPEWLSVRLHLPRALADDERHGRGDARRPRSRRRPDYERSPHSMRADAIGGGGGCGRDRAHGVGGDDVRARPDQAARRVRDRRR